MTDRLDRRDWMIGLTSSAAALALERQLDAAARLRQAARRRELKIVDLRVTPIALPDPPILAAGGCHGPYFLRHVVEIKTADGVVGIGETRGGETNRMGLLKSREFVLGNSAYGFRKFAARLKEFGNAVYAGVELACLDAIGRATGLRVCELLGGPVRDEVEFAAYLFYRYAADHPTILADPRIVDGRGRGAKALDAWGEVRTPEAMAELAWRFHQKWGFRVQKLKAGVFPPDQELKALRLIHERFDGKAPLRIDPNARWTMTTALRAAREIRKTRLEYYEDPVRGQAAMAAVRRKTGLVMSTNMCVTRFDHVAEAVKTRPVDVILADHHGWGGITACLGLGLLAEKVGWRLCQHSNNHAGVTMAAMIHVAATVPQMTYASDTHYVHLVEGADILRGPNLRIREGKMKLPSGPGLGVELDPDKLARAAEIYRKSGMRERDDAQTMRRLVPGWKRTLF